MSPKAPPLWTWPAALSLAALILAGGYGWEHQVHRALLGQALALDRLGGADVVILGTSKTRCGVLFDPAMDQMLQAGGRRARVVRITAPNARFDQFDEAFDRLRDRPPRLVLVEAELFTLEPGAFRDLDEGAELGWRETARAGLAALAGRTPSFAAEIADFNGGERGTRACAFARSLSPDAYRAMLRGRRASTPDERDAMLRRFDRLTSAGVAVGLLETNRSPQAARLFPPELARASRGILDQASRGGRLLVVGPPPALGPEEFLDLAHLNARGRDHYSRWLAGRIDGILEATP